MAGKLLLKRMAMAGVAAGILLSISGCWVLFSPVFFKDKALENAVRKALGRPFGLLTTRDLRKLGELQAAGLGITDLSGLEYCESLTVLNLRGNAVSSISPLNNLKNLVRLDLGENKIKNIEPVAGMLLLQELILYGDENEVVDWNPLRSNVLAGGLGAGDTVVLPTKTTIDSSGNPLANFADTQVVLLNAGVNVIYGSPSGDSGSGSSTTQ
ncbi:MAG TPA: leucine-rich repeat domain-containing protein [Candidatus Hydrogenedentes bacterium]|nr:leucine-rich repeat domain-containing protein [Candidatus Hydrogenedentota bacterium]HPU98653.1 leucine-rich repeat domain-containing protein [Candidatus Hydrogenedentota bacterium]